MVVFRATSVHGAARQVTRTLARVARSRVSSVAGPGGGPTPQSLVENLADAVLHVAGSAVAPPPVVLHPWEGLTCRDVLVALGDREPARVPVPVARRVVASAYACRKPGLARRLDMLWFGQSQTTTWLDDVGWRPPWGYDAWSRLGSAVTESAEPHSRPPKGHRP